VLGEGSPIDIEVELHLPTGELKRCAISFRPLSDEAGATNGAIACLTDVTESARMREELSHRATYDELTGCHNRASLMRALDARITDRGALAMPGVIFIDLDRFKQVNDRFGHACGNELLKIVAQRIKAVVRSRDIVGRIGGDEFLVMLPDVEDVEQAMKLAQRLAAALSLDVSLGDAIVANRASIGIACSSASRGDAESLVALADRAMYESKRQGAGQPSLA
jgi:diguanylate cyclase (GGDEF)-like protein